MKIMVEMEVNTLCDNPKYPECIIQYDLEGQTGNAWSILAMANDALKKAGVSKEERDLFHKRAMAGDYLDLRAEVATWVTAFEIGTYPGDYDENGQSLWDDDDD